MEYLVQISNLYDPFPNFSSSSSSSTLPCSSILFSTPDSNPVNSPTSTNYTCFYCWYFTDIPSVSIGPLVNSSLPVSTTPGSAAVYSSPPVSTTPGSVAVYSSPPVSTTPGSAAVYSSPPVSTTPGSAAVDWWGGINSSRTRCGRDWWGGVNSCRTRCGRDWWGEINSSSLFHAWFCCCLFFHTSPWFCCH